MSFWKRGSFLSGSNVRYPEIRLPSTPWRDFTSIKAKPFLPLTGSKSRLDALLQMRMKLATAKELDGEVVIKIQAWTTGRAGIGGVAFAKKNRMRFTPTQRGCW